MAFRSSFASVPLQVTFARGRKVLAALTEHPLRHSAVQRLQLLSGISVRHQAGLNVAKQPDFLIRHRILHVLRYRFVHVRRYHDSACNVLQPYPFLDTNRHRAKASVRSHCAFHARYGPHPVLDSNCKGLRHRIDVNIFWLCN